MDEAKVKQLLDKLNDPNVSEIVKHTIRDGLEKAMQGGFKAAYESQLRYRARTDLNAFAEYVFGYTPQSHHREITKVLMDESKKEILLIAPPGAAKCFPKNTCIYQQNGEKISAEFVKVGEKILSLDPETLKTAYGKVLWKEHTGQKECFRIKTKSGYFVDVTADHRMYTFGGWKECRDITTDDFMVAPRVVPIPEKTTPLPDSEIKLLAYWIAKGARQKDGNVRFSNCHVDILEEWATSGLYFGRGSTPIKRNDKIIGASLIKNKKCNHPRTLFLKHGLDPSTCGAVDKFIPDAIFRLPQDQLALFLNRLFACDGSIHQVWKRNKTSQNSTISYVSVSRELVDHIRHLLLRFGIMCSIGESMGQYKLSDGTTKYTLMAYKLQITEGQMVHKFMDEIGIFTKDCRFTPELKEATRNSSLNSVSDRVPKEWRKDLTKSTHYYREHHDIHVDKPGETFRGKVATIAEIEDNESLLRLAQSDIRWDAVVSIKSISSKNT